jgi:hypothetical protein
LIFHGKFFYHATGMKAHFSATMGRLGTTVTGTDPRSTGGHPQLSTEKGDSK